MAQNFKIVLRKNGDDVQIHLKGDFDGSSAMELCNVLEKHFSNYKNITINTSELTRIHPFGLNIFNIKYTPKKCVMFNVTFSGVHRKRFVKV